MEQSIDWLELLLENIQYQLRHANYERTIEVRKFAHMVTTGRGQETEVTRYRRFEDDELKDQRNRLYNPLTKYALARPRKYWKKMGRVEGIRRNFEAPDSQRETLKALQDSMFNFMPGQPLEDWLIKTLEFYGVTDPNAWIIYERNDTRDAQGIIQETKIFPFIVPSVDALNFEYGLDGLLRWFFCKTITVEHLFQKGSKLERVLENYYLYGPGVIYRAREVGEKTAIEDGEFEQIIDVFPATKEKQAVPRKFYLKEIKNGTTEVPAMPCGAYMDEATGSQTTYVPWFDPAEHILLDLIRYKQFSDVVSATHAYPKRWEFEKPCSYVSEHGECEGGYLNGIPSKENICPNCKGTGVPANFTTEQASIKMVLPKDAADGLLELSKLSFVEPIQVDFLSYLDNKIEAISAGIVTAVFDSGLYQKPTESKTKTATEIRSVMEGISDVLTPFGRVVSQHFETAYRVAAQYLELDLKVSHSFPEDLDIQTLSDEVAVFDEIKKAGVAYEATSAQRDRVIRKMYDSTPEIQKRIEVKYKHLPFADKSPEEVAMIISTRSPKDNERILWENYERILRDIFEADPKFAEKTYEKQKEAIAAKVEEVKALILLPEPEPFLEQPFNDDPAAPFEAN